MGVENICALCLAPAEQKCAGCQSVNYCSREHQKQHWKQHKYNCSAVRVKQDEKCGRYLEAIRNIKAGEIVLKEKPLITGPSQVTPPVCLGCYRLLESAKIRCEKCGWPFCSRECTRKDVHIPECHYTQQRGEKVSISTFGEPHPNYQSITVLRCLYQRDNNQKLWSKLQALETHHDDRKGTEKWNSDKKMVAEFIWKFYMLEGVFSEEEIMNCCGILQINGHEVPLLEPDYVAVFDRVSMAEHSCRATCSKSFSQQGEILLCAGVDIPSGGHVSDCYTDPLWGTEARRHHLAETKFFECECPRCIDVTEFNTKYSAVKCKKKDCKGFLLPLTFMMPILQKTKTPDPKTKNLDDKRWICGECKDEVSDSIIQQLLQDIGKELTAMPKGDVEACEKFLNHCSSYLHPSHYYLTDASLALAQLLGQENGLEILSDEQLLLKKTLCDHIINLMDTLAPAEMRIRGSLLFELHACVAENGRRRGALEGPLVMLGHVEESRRILLKAISLLRHEPECLPEGALCKSAIANLPQLDRLRTTLAAQLPSPI